MAPAEKQTLFRIEGLAKKFGDSAAYVLSDINLEIYSGECLVIAGANGSGKTQLTRIITGLAEASSGEVYFMGMPISKCVPKIRRSVGLVFQDADAQIVGETVEEDIRFGPENLKLTKAEVESRLNEALRLLALEEKRDYPPRRLSGGEKRRLAVAGVIAAGCETVIMDEPFANLDWPGVVQVLSIVRDLKERGKTVIVLTHELEKILAHVGRLIILAGGKIRADGRPAEVLDTLKPEWGVRDPRRSYALVEDCTWL